MATLEQIADALRKADAAGNVDDAKKLAAAYTAMKGQQTRGPLASRIQGEQLSSNIEDRTLPPAPGLGEKLLGSAAATANGIMQFPVIGPAITGASDAMIGGLSAATGGDYGKTVQHLQESRNATNRKYPIANLAGTLAADLGGFSAATATKVGSQALGLTGKLVPRMINSGLSTQGIGMADAMVRGKRGTEAITEPLAMSGVSAAIPALGSLFSRGGEAAANALTDARQTSATSKAIQVSPTAAELRAQAGQMFKAVDEAGVTADPAKFSGLVNNLVVGAKKMRIDPNLDPKASGAYQVLIGAVDDMQKAGTPLTVSDLHTLRQIAQKAATSAEGRDAMFANQIVDGLDSFIGQSGNLVGTSGKAGGNELLKAISTWGRAKRVSILEDAVTKAGYQKSGLENGLRLQFQSILRDPKKRRLFTGPELQTIEKVANGSTVSNLVTLMGKFGFGGGSAGNMMGGSIGALGAGAVGGFPAAIAAAVLGAGARGLSEGLGVRAADRAVRAAATPNLPVVQQVANPLLSAQRPLELLGKGALIAGMS